MTYASHPRLVASVKYQVPKVPVRPPVLVRLSQPGVKRKYPSYPKDDPAAPKPKEEEEKPEKTKPDPKAELKYTVEDVHTAGEVELRRLEESIELLRDSRVSELVSLAMGLFPNPTDAVRWLIDREDFCGSSHVEVFLDPESRQAVLNGLESIRRNPFRHWKSGAILSPNWYRLDARVAARSDHGGCTETRK